MQDLSRKRQSFKQHHSQEISEYDQKLNEAFAAIHQQRQDLDIDDIDILKSAFKKNDGDRVLKVPIDRLAGLMSDAQSSSMPTHKLRQYAQSANILGQITPANLADLYVHVKKDASKGAPSWLAPNKGLSRVTSRRIAKVLQEQPKQASEQPEENRMTATTSFSLAEVKAFSQWINRMLKDNSKAKHLLPINLESHDDFFSKLGDGILLNLMLQKVSNNLIDDRAVNWNTDKHVILKHENLNLAIGTATSIGCVTTNQHPAFILEGRPNMCLGLVWQIIRAGLFVNISLIENPNLIVLAREGETLEDLLKLSQEELLLRWVNYQLENNDNYDGNPITNFSKDTKDSVAYQYLMEEISDGRSGQANPLSQDNLLDRAESTLQMADRLDCREFVEPADIVSGQPRLNLAFVANLYNNYPNLKPSESEKIEETREEKTYRNWMNSLGIEPQITYLYTDLRNGIALLKLEDRTQPGIVKWNIVKMPPFKKLFALTSTQNNCRLAVQYARDMNLMVDFTDESDIRQGNKKLTLGLVWQLMRAYTLSLLRKLSDDPTKKIDDEDVVKWFNDKTGANIKQFNDQQLTDSVLIQKILKSLDPELEMEVLQNTSNVEQKMNNARYVISVARRMGAVVYTLPEDIVECHQNIPSKKMFLCLIVTLMVLEKELRMQEN